MKKQMVGKKLKRSTPFIMSCIASIGVAASVITAVKATPKAVELIKKDSRKNHDGDENAFTKKEAVISAWKCYIPTVICAAATIGCIMGANALNKKQQTALISAYALLNNSYKSYKNKVKELYGNEAHRRIMSELAVEKAEKVPITACTFTGTQTLGFDELNDEEVLFYDSMGERYFTSTIVKVLEAEYHLNRNFCLGWIPSLNDFYKFLGLEETQYGDMVGWSNADGSYYWIDFFHQKAEIDQSMDCWIISADQEPTADFLDDHDVPF